VRTTGHPFADQWNHNSHYYPLLRAAVPDTATRVLDIGCGDGTFCRLLVRPDRLVVGLDLDPRHLAPAPGVTYVVGSAEALGLADETFDAVTMTMVLHHVDARRALAEAVRVLAPGGSLQVLGIGRYGGPRDLPYELRDAVAHRLHSRGREPWEPPTTKVDPVETWSEVLTTVRRRLPGCAWDRLPMWRYRVTWTKPGREPA
jgi:SAM-dependent methyltransferase